MSKEIIRLARIGLRFDGIPFQDSVVVLVKFCAHMKGNFQVRIELQAKITLTCCDRTMV